MTDADKERSPKDESKRLLKVAATCLFYARAKSSDWEVFGRFARSAIRGTPSPAQRRQYTSVPSVRTELWRGTDNLKAPGILRYRGLKIGGYLLSHNAVQYHRRC